MSHQIKQAARTGVKMLIGLYSESGCGKTYSALLLARGLAGPKGVITMIDTESGRGSLYADDATIGGYQVLELDQPFSPARYIEAIDAAEQAGAAVIIIDSMSHEWEGIGGVTDMAAKSEADSGRPGLHNWNRPKMEHAKMLGRILRTKAHVICCIRAKYKTRQKKDERGKTVIVKDEATSPIQAEDFIFEMIVHSEILPNHNAVITKAHGELFSLLPESEKQPFTVQNGANLAKWCLGGKAAPASGAASKPAGATEATRNWMLTELAPYGTAALTEFAVFKAIIQPGQSLNDWPLAKVPTTKSGLRDLMGDIEAWKEKVGV